MKVWTSIIPSELTSWTEYDALLLCRILSSACKIIMPVNNAYIWYHPCIFPSVTTISPLLLHMQVIFIIKRAMEKPFISIYLYNIILISINLFALSQINYTASSVNRVLECPESSDAGTYHILLASLYWNLTHFEWVPANICPQQSTMLDPVCVSFRSLTGNLSSVCNLNSIILHSSFWTFCSAVQDLFGVEINFISFRVQCTA
jgi:hypothetical protein